MRFVIACLILLAASVSGFAQPKEVHTDPMSALTKSMDFRYQGEFCGPVKTGGQIGVQLVSKGSGKFEAVVYPGGLPGAGYPGTGKQKLTGALQGEVISLTGDAGAIEAQPDTVLWKPKDGMPTVLPRVERKSPTLGLKPPAYAEVLFDGSDAKRFKKGRVSQGLLMEGSDLIDTYRNFRLHLEFRLPFMPAMTGQKRANSGVYLQSRYEVQILDSFGLDGVFNECAALYRLQKPNINMCLPPLAWQTYDIDFQAPVFDSAGKKIRNAHITVWHNGVKVHDAFDIPRKTGAGRPEGKNPLPIRLQNHGDPVRFRNIWVIDYDNVQRRMITPPVPLEKLRS